MEDASRPTEDHERMKVNSNDRGEAILTRLRDDGALMRMSGSIRKELLQILRDPSSIAIAFLMPFVLLLLFGYGVSLDAEHVPVALVVEQPDAETASLVGSFMASRYFNRRSI